MIFYVNPSDKFDDIVANASDNDEICFLPGIHSKFSYAVINSYGNAMIRDSGKALKIYAKIPMETKIDVSEIPYSSTGYACLMCFGNEKTVIQGLHFIYKPKGTTNYTSAIWGYGCVGIVQNCYFEVIGDNATKSYRYDNLNKTLIIQNCNFSFESPLPINDYSGNPTYINNIYPKQPTLGTKSYDVIRQATQEDLYNIANDCKNAGFPSILNQDGTISHIGIHGGPEGYIWGRPFETKELYFVKLNNRIYYYDNEWIDLNKSQNEITLNDIIQYGMGKDSKFITLKYLKQLTEFNNSGKIEYVMGTHTIEEIKTLKIRPHDEIIKLDSVYNFNIIE